MKYFKRIKNRLTNNLRTDASFEIGRRPTRLCHDSKDDLRFVLDETSLVDRTMCEKGRWEPDQQSYLFSSATEIVRAATDQAVFLDIGAYWGLYSLRAARSGLFARVIALEPEPQNRAQLCTQIFLNGLAYEIDVVPIAASDSRQTVEFWRADRHAEGNRGGVGIASCESRDSIKVESSPLDELFEFEGCTLVVKIDVEGAESRVVRGAARTFSVNRCLLQVESFEQRSDELDEELTSLGFEKLNQIKYDHYYTNVSELTDATAPPRSS